jgi:hypothetical protein
LNGKPNNKLTSSASTSVSAPGFGKTTVVFDYNLGRTMGWYWIASVFSAGITVFGQDPGGHERILGNRDWTASGWAISGVGQTMSGFTLPASSPSASTPIFLVENSGVAYMEISFV